MKVRTAVLLAALSGAALVALWVSLATAADDMPTHRTELPPPTELTSAAADGGSTVADPVGGLPGAATERLDVAMCSDGVERLRNASLRRFLTTAKVHRKYGLTNIMLIAASMFAYAALDNRGVVFPAKSPVPLETVLFDIGRTQNCLAMANVLIETKAVVDSYNLKQTSAWRLGLHLGLRSLAGSLDHANASALLGKLKMNMGLTHAVPIVSYGDFFLRFPFYAVRPLDACFFMRRMFFQSAIESAARAQIAALKQLGSGTFMAVHLRLEADVLKLDKRLRMPTPGEVKRWWSQEIEMLVKSYRVSSVYVCAGDMDTSFWDAIRASSSVPVVQRQEKGQLHAAAGSTTNHADAAVDLLVAAAAHLAVSTERSTFFLAILSRRCPTPSKALTSFEQFRSSQLYVWGAGRSEAGHVGVADGVEPGVWSYEMSRGASMRLSALTHVGCSKPWQGHCFYDEP